MVAWKRLGKLCLISASVLAGGGALCRYNDVLNNQWCSSFRIVRFGRAANAVSYVPWFLGSCTVSVLMLFSTSVLLPLKDICVCNNVIVKAR